MVSLNSMVVGLPEAAESLDLPWNFPLGVACRLVSGSGEDAVGAAGEEAALCDADRWRTVDDVQNLIDGASKADGGVCTGRNDRAWRRKAGWQHELGLD